MKDYIILADITCDLSEDIRREIGMTDYLPGHVTIDDGRDLPTTLDWSNISREEFYKILGNKKRKVTPDGIFSGLFLLAQLRRAPGQRPLGGLRERQA